MKKTLILAIVGILMVGCVRIVVNINFPETEAKEAISTLEKDLLKSGEEEDGKNESEKDKSGENGKQSWMIRDFSLFSSTAYAAEIESREILKKIKSRPEVGKAYSNRSERLDEINRLRDEGKLGEGANGLLLLRVPEEELTEKERELWEDENEDRKVIIEALYLTILNINGAEDTPEARDEYLPRAEKAFAEALQDNAEDGWWIQLSNGKWKRK